VAKFRYLSLISNALSKVMPAREGSSSRPTLQGPVTDAEAVFIAVGTPSRRGDGHADLSYVYAASREIAKAVRNFAVVVTKSTVPVGTGDEAERIFMQESVGRRLRGFEP
jgi:UDPglucose 6-dehydrogenase